jgi:flagellar biosynthetic protein FliR
MPLELLAYYLKLPVFMMVLARMAGMLAIQPILSAVSIPMRVRALLVLALAALMTPFVEFPAAAPDTVGGLALAMGGELLVGSLMGLVIATCFVGLQMGGTLVAQNSGLAMGRVADPDSGEDMAILGSLYVQVAGVVYLVIGGHRALLAACLDTFEAVPLLGAAGLAEFGADLLLAALAAAGVLAIHVAAPAVLTLFMANLAMGFIARTVPQLNIVTIGFSLKALVAFLIMAVALPSGMSMFVDVLETSFAWLHELTAP